MPDNLDFVTDRIEWIVLVAETHNYNDSGPNHFSLTFAT